MLDLMGELCPAGGEITGKGLSGEDGRWYKSRKPDFRRGELCETQTSTANDVNRLSSLTRRARARRGRSALMSANERLKILSVKESVFIRV
jgi:hypothetical protein